MLLLHETHSIRGTCEEEFELAYRDGWLPKLADGDGARLLYFLHHAHGTGTSYRAITITALRDAAAWGELADRVQQGDLRTWAESLDDLRHDVTAKILVPLPWSPLQEIDLAEIPTDGQVREASLFMEDTVWPYEGQLERYVEKSGSHYFKSMQELSKKGVSLLEVQASFRTAFGSHRRREIVLWQKVVQPKGLVPLITREVDPKYKAPGTWMHDALDVRDQWESRLLRTARWSPAY